MTRASSKIRKQLSSRPDRKTFCKSRSSLLEIALENEVLSKTVIDLQKLLAEENRKVKKLSVGLHFYADEYEDPNQGPWGDSSSDFGKVARTILGFNAS